MWWDIAREECAGAGSADRDFVVNLKGDFAGQHPGDLVAVAVQMEETCGAGGHGLLDQHDALVGLVSRELQFREATGRGHCKMLPITCGYDEAPCRGHLGVLRLFGRTVAAQLIGDRICEIGLLNRSSVPFHTIPVGCPSRQGAAARSRALLSRYEGASIRLFRSLVLSLCEQQPCTGGGLPETDCSDASTGPMLSNWFSTPSRSRKIARPLLHCITPTVAMSMSPELRLTPGLDLLAL